MFVLTSEVPVPFGVVLGLPMSRELVELVITREVAVSLGVELLEDPISREEVVPAPELVPAPVSVPEPLVPVSRLQAAKSAEQASSAIHFFMRLLLWLVGCANKRHSGLLPAAFNQGAA